MSVGAPTDPTQQQPQDNAAKMDAAVRKAEEAEKKLHKAEAGPLESFSAGDDSQWEDDVPDQGAETGRRRQDGQGQQEQ
ncbi:MAG TPA: hypothetical protein VMS17_15270 [Gemmataceae bacterium]|nr:hypothetical protein [Gemmataceae bacterium]